MGILCKVGWARSAGLPSRFVSQSLLRRIAVELESQVELVPSCHD